MTIILDILAPTQIIIIGPKATFGKLLSIVKNGSTILDRSGNSYNKIAIRKPAEIPIAKESRVS